jgi:N-acetylglucosamine-6-sulfatase
MSMQRRLVVGLALALLGSVVAVQPDAEAIEDTRPNIVLIVADDMTKADLRWMPHTRELLGGHGVTMNNFLSNHPLCCPARAEILSGQYAQNSGTWHNAGPWGGTESFPYHDDSLAAWLNASGYQTAYVGKYMNLYERNPFVPLGWTDFDATSEGVYSPWGFSSINNGDEVRHEDVYTADWVARRTRALINDYAPSGAPFFIYAAQVPPHGMNVDGRWVAPVPARRHADLFPDAVSPATRKPSFNARGSLSGGTVLTVAQANRLHRARIRSLQAVDEATATTITALRDTGELANTVVVFTSDNGHLAGEHRHKGKDVPFDEAFRIPLLARGPGIPAGAVRNAMGSLTDLAPTFAAAAGVTPAFQVDGRNLLRLWTVGAGAGNTTTLIQSGDTDRMWDWRGVRTGRHTYIRLPGGREILFDRRIDPYELRNHAAAQPAVLADLRARYVALRDCAGPACVTASSG